MVVSVSCSPVMYNRNFTDVRGKDISTKFVVESYYTNDFMNGVCNYHIRYVNDPHGLNGQSFWIQDTVGKFKVNDTLWLSIYKQF